MRKAIFIFLFTTAFLSMGQKDADLIRDSFRIHFALGAEQVPADWKLKGEPLAERFREKCRKQIERAALKYPKKVLQECLQDVFLLGSLELEGAFAGGTIYEKQVFVANGSNLYFEKGPFEQTFHAEVSSVLLRKYPLPNLEARWKAIHSPEFNYFGITTEDYMNDDSTDVNLRLKFHEKGFLYSYAQTSWENDFNSFARYLLTDWKYFWYLLDDFPVLCEKTLLTIEFYSHIDPRWNWEYFHSLAF